jgi:phenylpyruvate tautomerase PptA (4-oxalocrotonate tautomerase family)
MKRFNDPSSAPEEAPMPNIVVHVPQGAYPGNARSALMQNINHAAASAEQMPNDPKKRFLCWVLIHEVAAGAWTCGALDMTQQVLPCFAVVHLPAGVLDDGARADYVRSMHDAFKRALPPDDTRQLMTSVVLHDVTDGTWGANGQLWRLPDFAQAAGYVHLQHLVKP